MEIIESKIKHFNLLPRLLFKLPLQNGTISEKKKNVQDKGLKLISLMPLKKLSDEKSFFATDL